MGTEAIIFDFDGVILDSFVILPAIYKVMNEELELEIPEEALDTGDFYRRYFRGNFSPPRRMHRGVGFYLNRNGVNPSGGGARVSRAASPRPKFLSREAR